MDTFRIWTKVSIHQLTLAGLYTVLQTSRPWLVYGQKNVSFVYTIIHAKYILFMMCRHSPLTVKHLTRYHTTVLPLSPWHSLSSSPTPVSSPHFMPRIIPKSITENFSKTQLSLPHTADLEKAGSGGSSTSRTLSQISTLQERHNHWNWIYG